MPNNRAVTDLDKEIVMDRLLYLWKKNPSLRLGQLIGNVFPCGPIPSGPDLKAAAAGEYELLPHRDAYNVEDLPFMEELENFYEARQHNT